MLSRDIAADFALLQTRLTGFEFSVQSKTEDNRRWIVAATQGGTTGNVLSARS